MPNGPRPLPAFLALGLTLLAVAPTPAGNWPRFRGPNGTGVAQDADLPVEFGAKDVLWKVKIPGEGNSSPVVWGAHVFFQTSTKKGTERSLLCLDADSGKTLWARSIPGSFVKYSQKYSSLAAATPATDGEAVYVPLWDGRDVILKAYSFKGDELWSRNLGEFVSQHGPGASPVVYKELVFLANDMDKKSTLYAFNKRTGETAWETPREGYRACYSAPFLLERAGVGTELVVTSTTAITGYHPESGKKNWEWHWDWGTGQPQRTVASSVAHDGTLVAVAGDGGGDRSMVGLRLPEGTGGKASKAWEKKDKQVGPYVPCPLVRGEHLYVVIDKGFLGCFHLRTGKQAWLERLPDTYFSASPVLVGDKIYAPSEQGDVYVFAAEPTYQLLARNELGETVRASPAVANNRLYVRGMQHLYCIGKK